MEVNRIKTPTYYVDVRDRRRRRSGNIIGHDVKPFTSLEEMTKWVKRNRERVWRVHYPSKNGYTSALGTSLEIFEEYISTGE